MFSDLRQAWPAVCSVQSLQIANIGQQTDDKDKIINAQHITIETLQQALSMAKDEIKRLRQMLK